MISRNEGHQLLIFKAFSLVFVCTGPLLGVPFQINDLSSYKDLGRQSSLKNLEEVYMLRFVYRPAYPGGTRLFIPIVVAVN
ncbi:MAG: hypothetical protein KDC31_11125 [Saprospiraceae bacterium]|nr:hypothetical protein [Candidatus Parvibacillus calidus]MBX2935554.1 hypothetical protein [Saprospiraceae bacterium]MBX7179923.1 hypothetical protein [Saprospiraceae bacterium]MCB0591835.1 hypothetical protein [Saprospiraceae bacterium]MCO5284736.1 hypothetical protein [Saprospiraceae bacterium]